MWKWISRHGLKVVTAMLVVTQATTLHWIVKVADEADEGFNMADAALTSINQIELDIDNIKSNQAQEVDLSQVEKDIDDLESATSSISYKIDEIEDNLKSLDWELSRLKTAISN